MITLTYWQLAGILFVAFALGVVITAVFDRRE